MLYPKIGIRPTIDGRWGGIRESLEAQTMGLAQAAQTLISSLRYPDGTPVQAVISPCTIGGGAEAARCEEYFATQNVIATLTVTPCWCYGMETFDMNPHTIKAVWGFNGTERPGAVYLAAVLAAYAQKGLPAFSIYGRDVQDLGDRSIPEDVAEKMLRFARCAVAVGWMKPVFRYGCAVYAAILGGRLLYALLWESFQNGQYFALLPMILCMIAGGAVGYYAASMLLAKTPRVFKTTWKGMLAVALGCAALCGAMKYDLFGVTRRIPAPDSVKLVNVYAAGSNYYLTPGKDDVLIEKVRTLHQTIIDDKDYIQKEAPGYGYYSDDYTASVEESAEDSGAQSTITHVRITYMLNSGLKVERGYRLYLTPDRMAREGTYDYLLDQLINSPEMRQKRIRWRDEGFQMTEAWFETWSGGGTLGSREAGLLLDAVAKDAENGDWGVYNWFLADNDADNYDLRIQFEYKLPESQFNRIHDTIRINVKEGMTETIRALKDLKLITDADLVTNRERYPWQYAAGGWDQYDQFYGQFHMSPEEYYERYSEYPAGWFGTESDDSSTETEIAPAVDDSHSPSMSDGAEATSFGIIGGADGPTVMVTTAA